MHDYDTRGRSLFKTPSLKLKCLSQTIKVKGVFWWNSIAKEIDVNCSISLFKKKAKLFMANYKL